MCFIDCFLEWFCHACNRTLCLLQIIARTEADTQVLAYSEGAVVPCTISADMSLAQATAELVKVCVLEEKVYSYLKEMKN